MGNGTITEELWTRLDFVNYIPDNEDQAPVDFNNILPPAAPTEGAEEPAAKNHPGPEGENNPPDPAVPPDPNPDTNPAPPPDPHIQINDELADVPDNNDSDEDASTVITEIQEPLPAKRTRRPSPRYYNDNMVNLARAERTRPKLQWADIYLATMDHTSPPQNHQAKCYSTMHTLQTDPDTGWVDEIDTLAFAAKANNDDSPSFRDAINGPDQQGFRTAMTLEWEQLVAKGTWVIADREEATKAGKKVVGIQWVFKHRRFPDGSIRKLKARLVVRGDQQVQGIDYFDTYAPVVSWTTVRTLLTMSCVLGLDTKQIDYTLAFFQATLEDPVFVDMPQSYQVPGKVLKLKKSLYGLAVAPKLFFETLKEALTQRGFVAFKTDPCMFVHKKMICLVYVDDCLFFGKRIQDINEMITSLKTSFDLNEEDNVAGFLGIKMNYLENGSIQLLQDGLKDRICAALGLDGMSNSTNTLTLAKPLGANKDGDPLGEAFNYRSVVGMILYLSSNSHPETLFAVSQCARFVHNPTAKHGEALKRISRYLLGVKGKAKGLVIKPNTDLNLELFADADFAGLWGHEDPTDPVCVRSRSGSVITLGGAPILWKSKLEFETALSTMMAEYIALSNSMRDLLPIKSIINEVTDAFQVKRDKTAFVTTCWEDNAGCSVLANLKDPQTTTRSKFYAIKLH